MADAKAATAAAAAAAAVVSATKELQEVFVVETPKSALGISIQIKGKSSQRDRPQPLLLVPFRCSDYKPQQTDAKADAWYCRAGMAVTLVDNYTVLPARDSVELPNPKAANASSLVAKPFVALDKHGVKKVTMEYLRPIVKFPQLLYELKNASGASGAFVGPTRCFVRFKVTFDGKGPAYDQLEVTRGGSHAPTGSGAWLKTVEPLSVECKNMSDAKSARLTINVNAESGFTCREFLTLASIELGHSLATANPALYDLLWSSGVKLFFNGVNLSKSDLALSSVKGLTTKSVLTLYYGDDSDESGDLGATDGAKLDATTAALKEVAKRVNTGEPPILESALKQLLLEQKFPASAVDDAIDSLQQSGMVVRALTLPMA